MFAWHLRAKRLPARNVSVIWHPNTSQSLRPRDICLSLPTLFRGYGRGPLLPELPETGTDQGQKKVKRDAERPTSRVYRGKQMFVDSFVETLQPMWMSRASCSSRRAPVCLSKSPTIDAVPVAASARPPPSRNIGHEHMDVYRNLIARMLNPRFAWSLVYCSRRHELEGGGSPPRGHERGGRFVTSSTTHDDPHTRHVWEVVTFEVLGSGPSGMNCVADIS